MKLRERKHGLLYFGEEPTNQFRWSITDPQSAELRDAVFRTRSRLFLYGKDDRTPEQKQRDTDLRHLLRCVEDYQHLTTYELGVEHIIKKLRAIWRAVRGGSDGRVG